MAKVMRLVVFLLISILCMIVISACDLGAAENEEAASVNQDNVITVTSVDQLIEEGKSLVEVTSISRANPLAPIPTFGVKVTNISDVLIEVINGTVVYFDEEGNPIPELISETGTADSLRSGETMELSMFLDHEEAVSGEWLIENIVYRKQLSGSGRMMLKWENPSFAADLEEIIGDLELPSEEVSEDGVEVEGE